MTAKSRTRDAFLLSHFFGNMGQTCLNSGLLFCRKDRGRFYVFKTNGDKGTVNAKITAFKSACHSEAHSDEESVSSYLHLGERILRLRFASLRMTVEITGRGTVPCPLYNNKKPN